MGRPCLALSWETDPECCEVLQHHFPWLQQRGDFMVDDPAKVAELVRRNDAHQCCRILVLGAPPCPDFSIICDDAPGFSGKEGAKFTGFADFLSALEQELAGWHFDLLCENVVMQKADEVQHISERLRASPVAVDASDLGLINRPRLWWNRLDWKVILQNPFTSQPFRWGSIHKLPRLYMDFPWLEPWDLELDGLRFPARVAKHECRLPCMTTPAPTAEGRPPPKKLRGRMRPDTRQRWLNDGRQYAPWHYDEEHMMLDPHNNLVLPTITVKEQLQGLPLNFTDVGSLPIRSRHRMMGNAWNATVARFLITLVIMFGGPTKPSSAMEIPLSPKCSALHFVTTLAKAEDPALGPVSINISEFSMRPTDDVWDHWDAAGYAQHPAVGTPKIEAGVLQLFGKWHVHFGDIHRLRWEVVAEVKELLEDFYPQTLDWANSLASHVRGVYTLSDHPGITQIPLVLHLLQQCNFPGLKDISQDLTQGFPLTGPQHHGPGWVSRQDERYAHPINHEAFKKLNAAYIRQKLQRARIDDHWRPMLEEIVQEKLAGRLDGPFVAPDDWPVKTVGIPGHPLKPLPTSEVLAAVCFSVQQSDKIRRCEDFKRSFHNSTLQATDVPTHHTVESYVHLCRHYGLHHTPSTLWTHDLDSAYRQFPVKEQSVAYTLLFLPEGPSLWCHGALCFGASASVWSFNRCADMIQFLARKLLLCPVHHFVDDFGAAEPVQLAESGFHSFSELFGALGLKMKSKKASPPSSCQKLLGVVMSISDKAITLTPCTERLAKIRSQIQMILHLNRLSSADAQRLAGKLVFLQTTIFGNVGRALSHPLYARAHGLGQDVERDTLNHPLRSSLFTLSHLLSELKPRSIPVTAQAPCTILYTDAYFKMGDLWYRPSDSNIPTKWDPSIAHHLENGWGFVIRIGSMVYAAHGSAPAHLIGKYCSRRAYIYFLELLAPVIAITLFSMRMPAFLVAFVDNTASLIALSKGYGRDESINRLVSFLWCLISRRSLHPHFTWVQSSHNISDKVSRHDLSDVYQQGWTLLTPDLDGLFSVLTACAVDQHYACTKAVDDALEWSSHAAFGGDLVQCGGLVPEVGADKAP